MLVNVLSTFGNYTAYEWTRDTSKCPNHTNQSKPFPSIFQGDHIRNDNICQSTNAAAANTLKISTNDHNSGIVRQCRDDSTNGEECQSNKKY
jgi:hypothetical protein